MSSTHPPAAAAIDLDEEEEIEEPAEPEEQQSRGRGRLDSPRAVTFNLERSRISLRVMNDRFELTANQTRPARRLECVVCSTCQEWRPRAIDAWEERLACGHLGDERLAHSRPCLYVTCTQNLFFEVQPNGNVKVNFPDREPEEMPPEDSCAIDNADLGGSTLERVGELMNVTRERIRQVERDLLLKLERYVEKGWIVLDRPGS